MWNTFRSSSSSSFFFFYYYYSFSFSSLEHCHVSLIFASRRLQLSSILLVSLYIV